MDDILVGYLLDALEPGERRSVEARLRADPEARARLGRLRRMMAPLDADAAPPPPPPGLADRTLARVADLPAPGLPKAPPVRGEAGGGGRRWFRRADVITAAVLLVLLSGVGAAWLVDQSRRARRAECAANLLVFWRSLETY